MAFLLQKFRSQLFRRPAAGVEAGELPGFRLPLDGKQVAAHAVHHGLHHAQHGVGGDGGVGSGTSPRQNLRPGLGGQDFAGGHDPLPGNDHRARLRAVRDDCPKS